MIDKPFGIVDMGEYLTGAKPWDLLEDRHRALSPRLENWFVIGSPTELASE